MSFTDPKIGYKSIRDNIITLFRNNETALNKNLTSTFSEDNQIEPGDPVVKPMLKGSFPYIMVEFVGKDEEDRGVGTAHTKVPIIRYRIFGAIKLRKDYEDVDAEVMNLLDNMEGLIRENISNINGSLWITPQSSEKMSGEARGTYISIAMLEVTVAVEVS